MPILYSPTTAGGAAGNGSAGRGAGTGAAVEDLLLSLSPRVTGAGRQLVFPLPDDLRWSSSVPGGHDRLSCTLPWLDRGKTPPDALRVLGVVHVVSRASGQVLWYGYIDDPGPEILPAGSQFKISATGPKTLLDSVRKPVLLCDRDLSHWIPDNAYPAGSMAVQDGAGTPAFIGNAIDGLGAAVSPTAYWEAGVPDGAALNIGQHSGINYWPPLYELAPVPAHAAIVGVHWSDMASAASTASRHRLYNSADGAVWTQVIDVACASTQQDFNAQEGIGAWVAPAINTRALQLRWHRTVTSITNSGDDWHRWTNVAVYGRRFERDGTSASVGNSNIAITPGIVVTDAMGRMTIGLVQQVPSNSYGPATPIIEQAAWFEGVSPREMIEYALQYVSEDWYAVWEPQTPDGLPAFQYGTFNNQSPRYILTRENSTLDLAGGAENLANKALVTYLRAADVPATLEVTANVPDLTRTGQTVTAGVDITDHGPVTATVAQNIGTSTLNLLNVTRAAGTATVFAPTLDYARGRVVQPWELEPGGIVRVTQTPQRYVSITGATPPDAETIFRITAVTVDPGSGTAELALDGGARSLLSRVRTPVNRAGAPSGQVGTNVPVPTSTRRRF